MHAPPDPGASLLTWAQWYAAQGWPVFPCRGKAPAIPSAHPPGDPLRGQCTGGCGRQGHGFHDATADDPFQIAEWWQQWPTANIGTPTGIWGWALDVDPRNGGDSTLYALERQHGTLPETPTSHTGGGGLHIDFALPAVGTIKHHARLGDGLDIQAIGGYIILPPSIHPDTQQAYLWDAVYDLSLPLAQAPDWLVALVQGAGQGGAGVPDLTGGGAIPEGQREATLVRLGSSLRHAGGTVDDIYAAITQANMRCVPPLEDTALQRISRSVSRYGVDPVMGTTVRVDTAPVPLPAQARGTPFDFSQAVTAKELAKMMRVPPRFLVQDLIPDGLTILAAPAKSYKSYFSLSLALATVGAGDWCDTFPVEQQGNVVFFALESPLPQLRNRLHQLRPHWQPADAEHELIFFSGMKCLPHFKAGLQAAVEACIERYQPRLIVIDPLSYLYRLGRQDDLASATLDLLWPLAEMAAQAQVSIVAPEHMRKRSKEDVSIVDQLAGSHIKAAIVHALLLMTRQGQDILIETTMRDAASQELALTFTFDDTSHTVVWGYKGANTAQVQYGNLRMQILHMLSSVQLALSIGDIVLSLQLADSRTTREAIRQALWRCQEAGEVQKTARGHYVWSGGAQGPGA